MTATIYAELEQGSADWHRLRAGIPTASEFGRIITSTGEASSQLGDYAALLAAEKYVGRSLEDWGGNRWTDRGLELEAEARDAYAFAYDAEVERVGFVEREGVGCSPDGLIGSDGVLELKCLSSKEHAKLVEYWLTHGAAPASYMPQARGQLYVTDRQWNHLFFYHPDLPPIRVVVERSLRWDSMLIRQIRAVLRRRDDLLEKLRRADKSQTRTA